MWRVSDRAPSFRLGRAHSALRARQGLDSPVCFHMPLPVNLIRSFYGTDRARKISSRDSIGYSWRGGRELDYGVCWVWELRPATSLVE
jgi:hypothetical protein